VRFLGVLVCALLFVLFPQKQSLADQAYWISQAKEQLRQGDREGALKAFQQAAWQKPQDPTIHYNMGVLADSLGRQGEAVGHYTAYLRWAPEAGDRESVKRKVFQLCGNLGALCYENRQYLLALDWYEKAKNLYPRAKAVHFNMCRVYEAKGDWRRAAGSLKEYHALCPPNEKGQVKNSIADLLRKEGEARFRAGEYDSALVNFQEAVRWNAEDSRLLLNQALAEEKLGYLADAKNHYLAYLQVDPTIEEREAVLERVVMLHGRLAEEYLDRGYLARAQDILDKGLEIDPENPDFHYLFAKTHLELGQPEQAVAYLERILKLGSKEDSARPYIQELVKLCTSLADEAYRKKEYGDALRFLKKALLWDPDNPVVAYNLARVYERENEWEQAILAYRRYLLLDPDAAERNEVKAKLAYYYSYLGAERFVRGEYALAQEAFEQALLVKPEDQALLYNLAMVLLKRGKTAEALHFLERYLRHEKDAQEIARVQRQIASLVNLTEEKNRRKRGENVSSELAAMAESQESVVERALADRERAFLLLQSGRWQEALGVYDECLRQFPSVRAEEAFQKELASAYREVSRAHLVDGNMTEALRALDEAKQWAPAEAFPYLWKGSVYEHRGNSQEALRIYRESLRRVEGSEGREAIRARIVSILMQRLQTALRQDDFHDALETMNTLEPYLDEDQARDVHYQKARIEEALGRRRAALVDYGFHVYEASQVLGDPRMRAELMDLLGDEPDLVVSLDDPSEAYQRGKEAANRGDHSKALFCFLMAKSGNRTPPDLDAEILRSLEALRMDRKALTILSRRGGGKRPLTLPRTEADQFISRAEAVLRDDYRTGQYEKGLERVRGVQAQLLIPDARLILLEGIFEEMIGSYEAAIRRYERALGEVATLPETEVSPVNQRLCGLLIRKALGEYDEGAYEACLDSLRRAEKAVPGRADVAFNLGCVYLRLRNPNGALQAFSRYMELEPDESPRKELTGNAIHLLQRQVARSPVVRYDGEGIAVDLVFERPVSLGHLLAAENQAGLDRKREQILDKVVLAPYLETPLGEEGADNAPAFAWD
jgi:tetratricopeptide (TPR) repeat protein